MARDFHETFERLRALLVAETTALKTGAMTNLAANADSKARILLELTHWREFDRPLSKEVVNGLTELLKDNAAVLELHMNAAKKISSSLAQHLRDADSDGTYRASYGLGYRS